MSQETEVTERNLSQTIKDCTAVIGGAALGAVVVIGAAWGIRAEIQREIEHMPAIEIDGVQNGLAPKTLELTPQSHDFSGNSAGPSLFASLDSYVVQFA
jgi:hypothetical protein